MSDDTKLTTDWPVLDTTGDALQLIKYMSEERARFVLATLVVSEATTLDAFRDAYRISLISPEQYANAK